MLKDYIGLKGAGKNATSDYGQTESGWRLQFVGSPVRFQIGDAVEPILVGELTVKLSQVRRKLAANGAHKLDQLLALVFIPRIVRIAAGAGVAGGGGVVVSGQAK